MQRKASSAPLLFDLDGTLLDTLGDIAASANAVRRHFGMRDASEAEVRDAIGDGVRELLRRLLHDDAQSGPSRAADGTKLARALELYREHHASQIGRACAPYPGVLEGLERLASKGHAFAIVSNKPERFCRDLVRLLDWGETFPVVVGGDSAQERKPHPAPIALATKELGVPARDAWMIGDSPGDLLAGRAAGCRQIVGVTYGYRPRHALEEVGVGQLVDNFDELVDLILGNA